MHSAQDFHPIQRQRERRIRIAWSVLIVSLLFAVVASGAPRPGAAIQVPTAIGTQFDAYVAGPEDATAGIVLLHDRFGLDSYTLDLADRFAKAGYRVLAPDLFDGRRNEDSDAAALMVGAVDPVWSDINTRAGLAYLRATGRKLAVVGYGYGGTAAMNAPVAAPTDVAAVVNYYGNVPSDLRGVQPLQAPVMGIFSRQESPISAGRVENFENAMRQLKRGVAILWTEAAPGFAHPGYDGFDEGAEQSAWRRAMEFLAETVPVGGSLSDVILDEVPPEPGTTSMELP